ncbi:hypothetical protein Ddc_09832 [Ditylenchus destructor]|nr:hypothetical protein Ddc_09832 [Ditylenchus destructor]
MQFHGRLADLLVEAGHEVHMLIQDINPYLANYTGANNHRVKITRVPRLPEKRDDFPKVDFIDNAFNGVNNMITDGASHGKLV